MGSLFDIGLSGLRASKYAMYVTANNIANANKPFYTRREVDFKENTPGKFGTGVSLGDVRRITDTLSEQQLLASKNSWAKSSAIYASLKGFETFVDNDEISISKFIDASATALESLNAIPTSNQGRNFYLDQLKNLSHRINGINSRINEEGHQAKKSFSEQVNETNRFLEQLAELNKKIKQTNDAEKSALQDTQDQVISQLSELIDFNKEIDESGAIQLHLGNGIPLLQGDYVASLVVSKGANTDSPFEIGIQNGNSVSSITSLIHGGKLAASLDYVNGKLNHLQHKLDRLSVSMALSMNQQNKLGINAQGLLGSDVFNDPNSLENTQNKVVANPWNQGEGTFSVMITDLKTLTDSDYRLSFDSPTHYTLIRQSDGGVVNDGSVSGFPCTFSGDGFSVEISSGEFFAGDNYLINPTKGGSEQLKVVAQSGAALALGVPVTTSASTQNKGAGQINLMAVTDINSGSFSIPNQLSPPLKIEFINATTYRLLNANDDSIIEDNISYDPSQTQNIFPTEGGYDPGYRVSLSGLIQAGDSFSINYNANGSGDNRNGLLLSALYKEKVVGPEGFTFSQSYQDLVFELTSSVNSAKINFDADEILKGQAQAARDEIAAVSLEEETMNLSRMQESYMANAQILEAVRQTMDALFAMFRR